MRRKLGIAVVILAVLLFLAASYLASQGKPGTVSPGPVRIEESFVLGRVRSVTEAGVDQDLMKKAGMLTRRQLAEVEILEGPYRGKILSVANEITDNPAYNIIVRPAQEVILSVVTEGGGKPEVNIADYHRASVLGFLTFVFLAAFLVFGGKRGFKSLVGLLVCVLLICLVLLPASLSGLNPLATAVVICLLATAATTLCSAGFTRKAAAAMLGTVGGIIVAGVAAQIVIAAAPLTGLSSEEAQILRGSVLNQPPRFYSGLLAAGMLIGALGVIMDVGVSVASAVFEVSRAGRHLSMRELYESGMSVGTDIMGTMTSTLVLAYAGGALPLLLLAAQMPSGKLLNLDLFATEIAAALSGSLGLVIAIPLTALAAARLMASNAVPGASCPSPRIAQNQGQAADAGRSNQSEGNRVVGSGSRADANGSPGPESPR